MRAAAGSVIIALVVLAAILAPFIALHPTHDIDLTARYVPPFWQENGSLSYPLGTDLLGRDVWSRLVYGTRVTLVVSLGALAVGGVLGAALGVIFGYRPGLLYRLFEMAPPWYMRVIWGVVAFICAFWIVGATGATLVNLVIALGLVTWPPYAKAMRLRIITRRPPPNAAHPQDAADSDPREDATGATVNGLSALVPRQLGFLVICESVLSFLGIGVPADIVSWGEMVASSRHAPGAWWTFAFPLAAVILLAIGFYMVGNWFRGRPAVAGGHTKRP